MKIKAQRGRSSGNWHEGMKELPESMKVFKNGAPTVSSNVLERNSQDKKTEEQ